MSYKFTDYIWKMDLRLPEKVVLLRMADYAGTDGGSIYPSVARVAKDCGLSDRAVQLILKKYVDEGLLVVVDEGGGRGRTRLYAMDEDRAKEMVGPSGEPKRAKRAKKTFTHSRPMNGHDPARETVKRVNESAEKGEEQIHPTLQEPSCKKEESVCDVDSNPRETHAQGTAESSEASKGNVVPFVKPSVPAVMPDGWVLPDEYRDYALSAGWTDVDGAAERFANHWLAKRDRGDRDAAHSEAGWLRQWKGWINGNLKWSREHGGQRHNHRNGGNGDLASVVLTDLPGWFGNAEGGSNG